MCESPMYKLYSSLQPLSLSRVPAPFFAAPTHPPAKWEFVTCVHRHEGRSPFPFQTQSPVAQIIDPKGERTERAFTPGRRVGISTVF